MSSCCVARTINYWCFSAGYSMSAVSTGAKSVILTSGTLKPLESFVAELRVYVLIVYSVYLALCVFSIVCI